MLSVAVSCPRTFASEVLAVSHPAHGSVAEYDYANLCVGLAYLVRAVRYSYPLVNVLSVEIERVKLDRAGYANGIYYGIGMPVYHIDLIIASPDGGIYHHRERFTVRVPSRKAMREALKRLFPFATVAR